MLGVGTGLTPPQQTPGQRNLKGENYLARWMIEAQAG
jgi:hypothetical protein